MIFVSHQNGIESDLITGRINALILEDSEEYTYLVEALWNQIHRIEEKLLFYGKENELLDMSKRCDIIFSPRDLSFQNSKISKKLFAYLTEQIQMSGLNDEIIKKANTPTYAKLPIISCIGFVNLLGTCTYIIITHIIPFIALVYILLI